MQVPPKTWPQVTQWLVAGSPTLNSRTRKQCGGSKSPSPLKIALGPLWKRTHLVGLPPLRCWAPSCWQLVSSSRDILHFFDYNLPSCQTTRAMSMLSWINKLERCPRQPFWCSWSASYMIAELNWHHIIANGIAINGLMTITHPDPVGFTPERRLSLTPVFEAFTLLPQILPDWKTPTLHTNPRRWRSWGGPIFLPTHDCGWTSLCGVDEILMTPPHITDSDLVHVMDLVWTSHTDKQQPHRQHLSWKKKCCCLLWVLLYFLPNLHVHVPCHFRLLREHFRISDGWSVKWKKSSRCFEVQLRPNRFRSGQAKTLKNRW